MYPKNGRVILHVDMNSFYASVEIAYDSSLKGKPVAIAGNEKERRGIIITSSYEARKHGVKTTMPVWQAKKLCPQLIIIPPNFERYRSASAKIFELFSMYTELVEPVSIDEGYLDITESSPLGSPLEIAKTIQTRLYETMELPCSIGIAPNKFLAKTASNMKKPLGITVLRKRDVEKVLWPLPVGEMHGVGSKTATKLNTKGIYTIGDLAQANDISLKAALGINGLRLKERANGIDKRPVDPSSVFDYKSIGNSTTLPQDVTNQKELVEVLRQLSTKVAYRLKNKQLLAQKIGITIKYKDRKSINRSQTLDNPTCNYENIHALAVTLFLKNWNGESVRLLGVTGFDVLDKELATKQLDLFSFESDAREEPLFDTLKQLQAKYGKQIIQKGISVQNHMKANTSFSKDFLDGLKK